MAAAVRTSATGSGTSGTGDRTCTATWAIGDALFVFFVVSANTNDTPTCSDDQSGTYTLLQCAKKNSSADRLGVFVRNQLIANTNSTVITVATGSNTAGLIVAVAVTGVLAGTTAVVQSAKADNGAASTAPAATFSAAALAENLSLGAAGNATDPATLHPPDPDWFELRDIGTFSPNIGLQVSYSSGWAGGTTVTWDGTSASAWGAVIVEAKAPPVLTATGSSFSWSAASAGLKAARVQSASASSFSWSATAAGLVHGVPISATSAAYTWTATAAGLVAARKIAADSASYSWGATDAGLRAGRAVVADSASYSWGATAAGLPAGRRVAADASSLTWSATAASLVRNVPLVAASASYAWTGTDATVRAARIQTADAAAYSWTAQSAELGSGRRFSASSASYAWTGTAVDFIVASPPPSITATSAVPGASTVTATVLGAATLSSPVGATVTTTATVLGAAAVTSTVPGTVSI